MDLWTGIDKLARLLMRERLRKLGLHYGWAGYASVGLMLILFVWEGAEAAARHAKQSTTAQLEILLSTLWGVWVMIAIATGKDLSWQIRLERILVFPVPGFLHLYAMAFLLGFLSLPLLVLLFAAEYWAYLNAGFDLAFLSSALIGCGLFIASVRLTASLVRVAMYHGRYLPKPLKAAALLAGLSLSIGAGASILYPHIGMLLPSHQFSLVLSGEHSRNPLICMAALTLLLGVVDLAVQRNLTYSGIRGPLAPGGRTMLRGGSLLFYPAWPGLLFRIATLGWLRNRNALLLLIWGGTYGFFYTYFSRPDEAFYFFAFIWMNLLFHSYLRGNLLGIDRGGIWLYYMFPVRIESILSSKSLSLSLLQGCTIASVIIAGFLRADPRISPADWNRVLIYAVASMLFGEICGLFFSLRYPDSIDRTSQYSGGTTAGALVVPALQLLFLVIFMLLSGLAHQHLSPAVYWCLLIATPASLSVVRFAILPTWVRKAMLSERETIFKKLSAFSS